MLKIVVTGCDRHRLRCLQRQKLNLLLDSRSSASVISNRRYEKQGSVVGWKDRITKREAMLQYIMVVLQ